MDFRHAASQPVGAPPSHENAWICRLASACEVRLFRNLDADVLSGHHNKSRNLPILFDQVLSLGTRYVGEKGFMNPGASVTVAIARHVPDLLNLRSVIGNLEQNSKFRFAFEKAVTTLTSDSRISIKICCNGYGCRGYHAKSTMAYRCPEERMLVLKQVRRFCRGQLQDSKIRDTSLLDRCIR